MKAITKNIIKTLIKPRAKSSNKGDYGHALIISGSSGEMGSAVIAARACLRSGCGLLTMNVPIEEKSILQVTIPEAMLTMRGKHIDDLTKFSAAGVGPGIGMIKESIQILSYLLREFKKPIVLDADALNIISSDKDLLGKLPAKTVLTPHPREYDRLFGIHKNIDERVLSAIDKAKKYNIIIVLKGHRTLVTNGVQSFFNTTGNAGLAKGGSGDALTGILTAFLAQGYPPFEAAKMAVYLHGLAADITMEEQSMESMLITDVIERIGKAFRDIMK